MPTYEYRCTKGHNFEVVESYTDEPLTKCQVCGAPVERVLHAPAVHFKGSGFYNTDYGTRKRQREQKASNSESSSSSESTSTKSGDSSGSGDSSSSDSSGSSDSKPAEKASGSSDSSKPAKTKS
ncbi:MAG TPA: FmdB family zinc ribbon protein [Solirubrobacteraceae bacterium]|nr:FmdB family zinc ribbon protein [Solirubrobacteraceae bacterium]